MKQEDILCYENTLDGKTTTKQHRRTRIKSQKEPSSLLLDFVYPSRPLEDQHTAPTSPDVWQSRTKFPTPYA